MADYEGYPTPEQVRALVFGFGETANFEEAVLVFRAARDVRNDILATQGKILSGTIESELTCDSIVHSTQVYSEAIHLGTKAFEEIQASLGRMSLSSKERVLEMRKVISGESYF